MKGPLPLLHIDSGHNLPETIEDRDRWTEEIGAKRRTGTRADGQRSAAAMEGRKRGGYF